MTMSRWWLQRFPFLPLLGKWCILTNSFPMGWSHQLDTIWNGPVTHSNIFMFCRWNNWCPGVLFVNVFWMALHLSMGPFDNFVRDESGMRKHFDHQAKTHHQKQDLWIFKIAYLQISTLDFKSSCWKNGRYFFVVASKKAANVWQFDRRNPLGSFQSLEASLWDFHQWRAVRQLSSAMGWSDENGWKIWRWNFLKNKTTFGFIFRQVIFGSGPQQKHGVRATTRMTWNIFRIGNLELNLICHDCILGGWLIRLIWWLF